MNGARGNRARRDDFIDILAEVKNLLRHLHPAIQQMPKIERIEGAAMTMKQAAYRMLACYHTAYRCPEARLAKTQEMIGWYGVLQDSFELALLQGIVRDCFKLPIAEHMERIEKGVMKWHASQAKSAQRQERGTGTDLFGKTGAAASDYAE